MALHHLLDRSAQRQPDHVAINAPGHGVITYQALAQLSDRLRDQLYQLGVRHGDRVGLYLHKSIDTITAIFGILKTGAAYVPVDPNAPPTRNAYILQDCSVKVVIVEACFADGLCAALTQPGPIPHLFCLEGVGSGQALQQALLQQGEPAIAQTADSALHDLAYILYTSGSTGKPKGVQISHQAALSFIDWCSTIFQPTAQDRFSSHAPIHFDLSILDIYVPIKHGGSVVLIAEDVGKDPQRLAALIAETQITSWYSTPSILSLLAQYGKLEQHEYSTLRTILFAGEVFPIKHLRTLKALLPGPRYFNLYGPTETNVCTYYEVPTHIPAEQTQPFPIGRACSHYQIKVVDEAGQTVAAGQEGELCAGGPGVMSGYWNLPERTAQAFLTDTLGEQWYKTGDIVVQEPDGNYIYIGRRDRMVKKRGYRIELGEIEAGLYRHAAIREAAVVAIKNQEQGVQIKAFVSCREEAKRPSLIELKRFCAETLPAYMAPDFFSFQATLPKTSTDKIDYQKLMQMAE